MANNLVPTNLQTAQLAKAIKRHQWQWVKELIKGGADCKQLTSLKDSSQLLAEAILQKQYWLAKKLIEADCDFKKVATKQNYSDLAYALIESPSFMHYLHNKKLTKEIFVQSAQAAAIKENYLWMCEQCKTLLQLKLFIRFVMLTNEEYFKILSNSYVINNLPLVRYICDLGVDVTKYEGPYNPLEEAIENGNLAVIKYLVEKGAPIRYASLNNIPNKEILHYFISQGVDKNYLLDCISDRYFHHNPNNLLIEELLNEGADIDYVTYIHTPQEVFWLKERGKNLNLSYKHLCNVEKCIPLVYAFNYALVDVGIALLEAGANPNQVQENDGLTVLDILCQGGGGTGVFWSASFKMQELRRFANALFRYGAEVHKKNVLDILSHNTQIPLDLLEEFIKRGADVNAQDENGRTPLLWSIERDLPETAELLLRYGANPNQADKNGWTPLAAAEALGTPHLINTLRSAMAQSKKLSDNTLS